MAANRTSPIIGIDFGTTYSCVGVYRDGNVEIIPNDQGNTITPNFVAFHDTETLIGEAARNHATKNLDNTIIDVKRLIGRKFTDQSVQSDTEHWPFKVISKDSEPNVQIRLAAEVKTFSPEQVTSMIFTKLKESAEDFLKTDVSDAIIAVPPYFDDAERQAVKKAGVLAGLNILQVLSEPTAALIAYGYEKEVVPEERNFLVFDLGSRTCTVSLMLIDDGIFEIRTSSQDTQSGGDAFTNRLVEHFSAEFKHKFGTDISNDDSAMYRLRIATEKGKCALSSRDQTSIEIENLLQSIDFRTSINREKFEHLCDDLFQKCIQQVNHVLHEAKTDKSKIYKVILVGGSTRIPKIKELLQTFFNGNILHDINPDEVIARGAAKYGFILASKGPATSCCLGTELSLGVETSDGFMETVIPRHSTEPCRATRIFTTSNPTVSIRVYEGERPFANDNHKVGVLQLFEIAPVPSPKVSVTFDIDANSILSVTAEVQGSSLSNSTVTADFDFNVRPAKDDVKRMLNDAEEHRAKDEADRQKVALKTGLKALP